MKQFHGFHKKHSFFEGWYLKHQKDNFSLALIPAYHIDHQGHRKASIQVITNECTGSFDFPISCFHVNQTKFQVKIGKNHFSENGIWIDLKSPDCTIQGHLEYGPLTTCESDVMGPFSYLPFLQCNHGVLSLTHTITGVLKINGSQVDFSGGTGYIEKDWGSSFPQSYLWTQCCWMNQYNHQPCSIMVSMADIPIGPAKFTGCIASIYYGKTEYRMATYKKVKIIKYTSGDVILEQGNLLLHIHVLQDSPSRLHAPDKGSMSRIIEESISCRVRYQFFIRRKKIFDIISSNASFEYSKSS